MEVQGEIAGRIKLLPGRAGEVKLTLRLLDF